MLTDNYAWLLTDAATKKVGIVDPSQAEPVMAALHAMGSGLDYIFLTHHHHDHTGGVEALREMYFSNVVGCAADAKRLPVLDLAVQEGSAVLFGATLVKVINVPGHTIGHIAYYLPDDHCLFPGDTMFSMGCGRLFEGTAEQMFATLQRLKSLPPDTLVYPAHEYTGTNAKFAMQVDPYNDAVVARAVEVVARRAEGRPTLPVTLGQELQTNPFLRAPNAGVFARLRAARDMF
jgi:hydroxyacylglutathione hydrolase